jgi:hypothetical protein
MQMGVPLLPQSVRDAPAITSKRTPQDVARVDMLG